MPNPSRLTGTPIKQILCRTSGKLVGFLYQWNTGEILPAWRNGPVADIQYAPLEDEAETGCRDTADGVGGTSKKMLIERD